MLVVCVCGLCKRPSLISLPRNFAMHSCGLAAFLSSAMTCPNATMTELTSKATIDVRFPARGLKWLIWNMTRAMSCSETQTTTDLADVDQTDCDAL